MRQKVSFEINLVNQELGFTEDQLVLTADQLVEGQLQTQLNWLRPDF